MKLLDNEIPQLSVFKLYRHEENLHSPIQKNIVPFIAEHKNADGE